MNHLLDELAKRIGHPAPFKKRFAGLDVVVENPKHSVRSGVDKNGNEWSIRMNNDYGFLPKGTGQDDESLDCFLGPNENPHEIYVIHQNDLEGNYDEDKIVIGADSAEQAKKIYLSNYDTPRYFRSMTIIPIDTFKEMLHRGKLGSVRWKRRNKRPVKTRALFDADETMGRITYTALLDILRERDYEDAEFMNSERGDGHVRKARAYWESHHRRGRKGRYVHKPAMAESKKIDSRRYTVHVAKEGENRYEVLDTKLNKVVAKFSDLIKAEAAANHRNNIKE